MFSMLGYYVQGVVTRQGPVENWSTHIADPTSANLFAYTSDLAMFASAGDKLAEVGSAMWEAQFSTGPWLVTKP